VLIFIEVAGRSWMIPSIIPFVWPHRRNIELPHTTPTAVKMLPQTRHCVDRAKIFDQFKQHYKCFEEFTVLNSNSVWESLGGECFSKKLYLPGAQFGATPYQLKGAVSLGSLAFSPLNSLATRSAMLFHFNYPEYVDYIFSHRKFH
jgi:hypothetical protein